MEEADDVGCCRWQEGSTTARHASRVAAALDALLADGLVGHPGSTSDGATWARAARVCLDSRGVSEAKSADRSAATKILGSMERYGFVRAKLERRHCVGPLEAWNETAGELTAAGRRLVDAWRRGDTAEVEACVLAAMALRSLPSPLEDDWSRPPVNPVGIVAAVLLALEAIDPNEGFLAPAEAACFVQTADGSSCPHGVAERILAYREAKTRSADHRAFEEAALVAAAGRGGRQVRPDTVMSYADVAFRWCEDTGVFRRCKLGRKLVLRLAPTQEARMKAAALARGMAPANGLADPLTYLTRLEAGHFDHSAPASAVAEVELVRRDTRRAAQALRELLGILESGEGLARTRRRIAAQDPETLRREQDAADNPARDWPAVRELLINLTEEADLGIEALKPSAALEWALFRSLLLLVGPGGLATLAEQARRFQIAADLLPISTAPGRGSDVEFRCRGGLLMAGEATLTTGSRQAATEGEAVRRHAAELTRQAGTAGRAVSVFVAPTIDLNTLDWFRQGSHWLDGERVSADVVPLTIGQVVALGDAVAVRGGGTLAWLRGFLEECLLGREAGPLAWLEGIAEAVRHAVEEGGVATVQRGGRAMPLAVAPAAVRRQAPRNRGKGQGSLFDLMA